MSKWTTGKDLSAYWDLEGFEFFRLLKKGLQPYDDLGRKVIDADTLEKGKRQSLEEIIRNLKTKREAQVLPAGPKSRIRPRRTDAELELAAKAYYERVPTEILNPPKNNPYMSFTLPSNKKKAHEAIEKAMGFLFHQGESSEFAEKHGYRILKEQNGGNASGLSKETLRAPEMAYQPWVTGEWVKKTVPTDDSGLLSLIYEEVLTAHTEGLEPVTPKDIRLMINDPVGNLSPAWPMAGLDGLRFRKTEVLRFIEGQQSEDVALDEGKDATKSNSIDQEVKPTVKDTETVRNERFPNTIAKIRTGQNVQWEDIKISFLGDEEILVQYGEEHAERKFNQAGFENRKNGKPVQSWVALREAAHKKQGELPYSFETRKHIEKIVQDLNSKFCSLFPGIPGKPISLSKEERLYKPACQISYNI